MLNRVVLACVILALRTFSEQVEDSSRVVLRLTVMQRTISDDDARAFIKVVERSRLAVNRGPWPTCWAEISRHNPSAGPISDSWLLDAAGAQIMDFEALDHGASVFLLVDVLDGGAPFHATLRGLSVNGGKAWDPWVARVAGNASYYRLFFLSVPKQMIQPGREFWAYSQISTSRSAAEYPNRWGLVYNVKWRGWGRLFDPSRSRILAGCSVFAHGRYYMWFSTGLMEDRREGAILLGVSADGVVFTPLSSWTPMAPDARWYQPQGRSSLAYLAWRDPFLFQDAPNGRQLLFLAADLPWNTNATSFKMCWEQAASATDSCHDSQYQGTIGVAELPVDPVAGGWRLQPPAAAPYVWSHFTLKKKYGNFLVSGNQSGFWEMERPQVLQHAGTYHLFFNCWGFHINPMWSRKHLRTLVDATKGSTQKIEHHSALYHFVAHSAAGPYSPSEVTPIVPGSESTNLYGIHFVPAFGPNASSMRTERDSAPEWLVFGWNRGEVSLEVSGSYRLQFDASGEPLIFQRGG